LTVKERIATTAADAHRWSLAKVREVMRHSIYRRDREAPHLAELRNLEIKGAAGPLDARLYVPKSAPSKGPLLIYFHGGGFVFGGLDTHDALCTRLAHESGVRILSCSYRLAPEHPFPAQRDDALAAAKWVLANAWRVGADKRRLLIGGDSAGGYLALTVARALPKAFAGQLLIYPLMHLEDDLWASGFAADTRLIGRLAVRYIEAQIAKAGVRAPSLLADSAITPLRTVIVAGGRLDPCAPDAAACADRLSALGAKVERRSYPPLMHGFANLTHLSAEARRAVTEIGGLLRELAAR